MINMMKADFYRLIRNKAFYIAIALILFILSASIYIIQPGYFGLSSASVESTQETSPAMAAMSEMTKEEIQNLSVTDLREMMLETEGYELDRDILGANMNLYYIFIFIAVIALTSDFSSGGVKNTLSSAINRKKYFFSKLGFVTLCCTALFFLNTYLAYLGNLIFNGEKLSSGLGAMTKISFMQLPEIIAIVCILTGIGFMVKKTSLFVTLTIPLMMVFQILMSLAKTLFKIKDSVMGYEFQTMFTRLAGDPSDSYIVHSYILCACVIAVFITLGYLSFKKSEIK